jgi:hypothetical protein
MTTESDKNQQNEGKSALTDRQRKFIPLLIASPTISDACDKGDVDRSTYYEWLEQPAFKAELDRQRDKIAQDALDTLTHSLTKAVDTLVKLLDSADNRLKRLVANDIVSHFLERKAIEDLDKRLAAIEQKLSKTN